MFVTKDYPRKEPWRPLISVLYVSWNSRDDLEASLRHLLAGAAEGELELIVVDNASTDGTVEALRATALPVQIIANPDNRGFSVAVNQGFAASRGEFVLMLNPDVRLELPVLRTMVAFLGACPAAGACTPLLVGHDGASTLNSVPFPKITRLSNPALRTYQPGQRVDCPAGPWGQAAIAHWVAGACLLTRRSVFEATGGMGEGYFLYWEDVDWCYRVFRAGWQVVMLEELTAIHEGGASANQMPSSLTQLRRADGYFRYLSDNHGALRTRLMFVHWLLTAAVLAALLTPLSLAVPRLGWRAFFDRCRLQFCLKTCGRPFWRCQFGRNFD